MGGAKSFMPLKRRSAAENALAIRAAEKIDGSTALRFGRDHGGSRGFNRRLAVTDFTQRVEDHGAHNIGVLIGPATTTRPGTRYYRRKFTQTNTTHRQTSGKSTGLGLDVTSALIERIRILST